MQLNGNQLFDSCSWPPQPDSITRAWHEIVHGNNLKAPNNQLHIVADFDGTGQAALSDFVLLYHA
jgi:hypothetical protein